MHPDVAVEASETQAQLGLVSLGHAAYAATMISLGILGLISRDFTPIWSGVYKAAPARQALIYICALVSLLSGVGLLWRRTAIVVSRVLLSYLAAWFLLFRLPQLFLAPKSIGPWWASGDSAVMLAGAWVLYAEFGIEMGRDAAGSGERGLRTAQALYGMGLIPFGVAHFTNLQDTAPVVPAWLPWHVMWAYFTGGAFIVAGLAVLIGFFSRLAAVLSAWEIGLFTLLVWVPIVIQGPNAFQWTEFVSSCALTGAAWAVASSYKGVPWFEVRRAKSAPLGASAT